MKLTKTIETPLPEEVIQHIQSFMSGKEAARSAILSKSWYTAWLTRPAIDFDFENRDIDGYHLFKELMEKTIQRYQDSGLKILSFRLCMAKRSMVRNSIAKAMELGATDVELELPPICPNSSLPQEVLASKTLVRLSVKGIRLDGNYLVRCSRLKSLSFTSFNFRCGDDHVFKDLTTSCVSLEELSVSKCFRLVITRENMNELHKLRSLYLEHVKFESSFFTGFASRFPCLKDLTILQPRRCKSIKIASTSLETISFKLIKLSGDPYGFKYPNEVEFDVPNVRKFTCMIKGLPSEVSVNGALTEWDFDVFISLKFFPNKTWFSKLKTLVENQFKRSRIVSLSLAFRPSYDYYSEPDTVDLDKAKPQVTRPLVVDNLRITGTRSSSALLLALFDDIHPKMITHCLHGNDYHKTFSGNEALEKLWRCYEKEALDGLCQMLMPSCGVPDQDMFGKFGFKRVLNAEVMEKFGTEWRPLVLEKLLDATTIPVINEREVRFKLIWQ